MVAVVLGALVLVPSASATTFCVPNYFADCPNSGGNVSTGNLDTAFSMNGSDGIPDTVHIDEFTYPAPAPMNMAGTDDMTVIGSGRDKSVITTTSSANAYVLRTNNRTGQVTMKDLAIVVPDSFPDSGGEGAALQAKKLDLERVDVISENPSSDGIANMIGGGTFRDVHIFGRNGGSVDRAIDGDMCDAGVLTLSDIQIEGEGTTISSKCASRPVVLERSELASTGSILSVAFGASMDVSNTIIKGGDFTPILLYNKATATNLKLDHVTALALGDNSVPAIQPQMGNTASSTGDVNVQVRNSIIAGYTKTWGIVGQTSSEKGNINLTLAYSNFAPNGDAEGDVTIDQSTGNMNENPGFVGITDFHLSQSSPMVDAGDPNAASPELDFEGNARPIDGDYDGTAIRDIGAYELNPPPPSCPIDPTKCPDTTKPKVSKVKFRFKAGKGGLLRMRLSESSRVRAALVPLPKGKGKRKKVVIVRNAKTGPLVVKLGKRRLGKGLYRLAITAVDPSGNRSNPIVRRVRAR